MLNNKSISKEFVFTIIVIAAILGGGNAVATKIAIKEIPPFSFAFIRFCVASLCILPFFLRSNPKLGKDFYKVILFSLFMTYNATIFTVGVALTTATISQVLYSFVPIIVAILGFYFFGEKLIKRKIAGILIGFFGAMIVILLPVLTNNAAFTGNLLGNLIIFSAAVSVALYTALAKPFQNHYTPLQLTSFFIFTSTIVTFFLAITDLSLHPRWWDNVSVNAVLLAGYGGSLGTAIWYLLYLYVIKHSSPVSASTLLYLQPATAFVWAAFLIGEQLTVGLMIGVAITFLGLYLVLKSK
jgi:drug/metabolite transporter (DMT)-like permease